MNDHTTEKKGKKDVNITKQEEKNQKKGIDFRQKN